MSENIEKTPVRKRTKDHEPVAPRMFDYHQAAAYTGLSYWTIREVALRGNFPIVRVGRRVLIDRKDLDAWLEASKEQERIY